MKFYERVQDPTDVLHAFKPFVPVFKGLETLEAEDHVMTEFLVMGDLLAAYKKPACMDVKIGESYFYLRQEGKLIVRTSSSPSTPGKFDSHWCC